MTNTMQFHTAKKEGRKITMVTCYDYTFAKILNKSKVDCLLVGDSLAMVMHGHATTLPATTEVMALHTQAVVRGAPNKFVVADMPFLSFRKGIKDTLDNVQLLMSAGAHAVKLEGVAGHEESVKAIVESGVPVMGHIGLTPQSIHGLGGFKVQGRESEAAAQLIEFAIRLQDLGCFAIVLECVPAALGAEITRKLEIPTIGIGAGVGCDGQVLVLQDLLGMNTEFRPKFLRHFLKGEELMRAAFDSYADEVQSQTFPKPTESYE
jgi:3-methyl-2-oxobutanoate hydroxymethyltransferase